MAKKIAAVPPESGLPGLLPDSPVCRAFDPAKWAFDIGTQILAAYGHTGRGGRAIIARWVRDWEPFKLVEILMRAGAAERGDVVQYIERALRGELDVATSLSTAASEDDASAEERRFRRRIEGLVRAHMLHLADAQEIARAVRLGVIEACP